MENAAIENKHRRLATNWYGLWANKRWWSIYLLSLSVIKFEGPIIDSLWLNWKFVWPRRQWWIFQVLGIRPGIYLSFGCEGSTDGVETTTAPLLMVFWAGWIEMSFGCRVAKDRLKWAQFVRDGRLDGQKMENVLLSWRKISHLVSQPMHDDRGGRAKEQCERRWQIRSGWSWDVAGCCYSSQYGYGGASTRCFKNSKSMQNGGVQFNVQSPQLTAIWWANPKQVARQATEGRERWRWWRRRANDCCNHLIIVN